MKLLFLSNNTVSQPLAEWLKERVELMRLEEKLSLAHIEQFKPELIVSYSYNHIIGATLLNLRPHRFVNLHISYLPYNRGADPNAWSFLENTPKGVSIHLIDSGIDTGPVLAQEQVEFDENTETLAHSYQLLQERIQSLFRNHWEAIKQQSLQPTAQTGIGTFHKASQFSAIKEQLLGQEGWDIPIPLFKERYRRLTRAQSAST